MVRGVLAVVVVGCAPDIDLPTIFENPLEARSGARIAVVFHEYSDGTRQLEPSYFHDIDVGEWCRPALWTDGSTRCTYDAGQVVFTDETCSTPVGQHTVGGVMPRYFAAYEGTGDDRPIAKLFGAGAERDLREHWDLRDGTCVGPIAEPETFAHVDLASEIEAEDLAAMTRQQVPSNVRLERITWSSKDGMNAPVGLYDRDLGMPCTFEPRPHDRQTRCVPEATSASHYLDAACTIPAAAVSASSAPPAAITYRADTATCADYFTVGAKQTAAVAYDRLASGECVVATEASASYYGLGDPLTLPELSRAVGVRRARFETIPVVGDGAALEPPFEDTFLYDWLFQTDCQRSSVEGFERCLPATPAPLQENLFTDASCRMPAIPLARVPVVGCGRPPPYAVSANRTFFKIGEPYREEVYNRVGNICISAVAEAHAFHQVGDPIAPGKFAHARPVPLPP